MLKSRLLALESQNLGEHAIPEEAPIRKVAQPMETDTGSDEEEKKFKEKLQLGVTK